MATSRSIKTTAATKPVKAARSAAPAKPVAARKPANVSAKTPKKAPAKAATPTSTFTKKEIDVLKATLLAEQAELTTQLSTIEENSFAASQSDMTGEVAFDDETADAGTATFERERDLSIENNVRDLMRKVERALGRIGAGTYGICDRCGKPIEKARIKALPYVDLCIKDAQAQSRR